MEAQALQWATEQGITDGTRLYDNVTRQEAITMLYRKYTKLQNAPPLPFTAEELDILYRIVWAEARGEDEKGQILVVNVIMNRVNSSQFPNTIRDVIFESNQFSPVTDGSFESATPTQFIKDAVHKALLGTDYSNGALFFASLAVANNPNSWHERSLTRLFTHGGHAFYI